MPLDQYELVDRFGSAVDAGVGALFVGAGLSMQAGLPGWGEILKAPAAELGLPGEIGDDLPLLAEYYEQNAPGGRGALRHALLQQLKATDTPGRGHQLVAALPVPEIWTTNYDPLLEREMPYGHLAVTDDDLRAVGTGRASIIKMHGSFTLDPEPRWTADPVITRGDYERYEVQRPRTWALLRASYLTRTLLFLGFSFTDPNIDVLLRLARLHGTAAGDRHLTVLRRPPSGPARRLHDLRVRDLERSGVQVCALDDFAELVPLLEALVRRTRPPRLFISGSGGEAELLPWCQKAAAALAQHDEWQLTSLGGPAGWWITRQVARQRRAAGNYQPDRLLLHFRRRPGEAAPELDERVGTAVFHDLEREALVPAVLDQCRAMLVLQGGERTLQEVDWARQRGVGVVPVAASGGTARAAWRALASPPPRLGGRDVPARQWALLDDDDPNVAVLAATRLLEQAMYRAVP